MVLPEAAATCSAGSVSASTIELTIPSTTLPHCEAERSSGVTPWASSTCRRSFSRAKPI